MNKTQDIKNTIANILIEIIGNITKSVSCHYALSSAPFPRVVFDIKELNSGLCSQYKLEINVYSQESYAQADDIIDEICLSICQSTFLTSQNGLLEIYSETINRQTLPDENKEIKRRQAIFEMIYIN